MKTTDATVLDEPKTHRRATEETIEPAIESRPRATTGVREAKIYIDGKFYSEANAKVSVFDHGLLYGDGIFEGIRFYNGRVFRLEQHFERLWNSARSICLDIPMTRQEMTEALLETIEMLLGVVRPVTPGVNIVSADMLMAFVPSAEPVSTCIVPFVRLVPKL